MTDANSLRRSPYPSWSPEDGAPGGPTDRDVEAVLEAMYLDSLRTLLTMEHPAGRRFVHLLMGRCGLHSELPVADHALMARAAGRRSVALELRRGAADIDPDLPWRMAREARVERDAIPTDPEEGRSGW